MKLKFWSVCFVIFLSGCVSFNPPRNDGAKFYALSPKQIKTNRKIPDQIPVGLLAIQLPDYLRNSTWLQWKSDVELKPIKTFRWAEPLELNIARVINTNLNSQCKITCIESVPWLSEKNKALWIKLTIIDCHHSVTDNSLSFYASWKFYDRKMRQLLKVSEFRFGTKTDGTPETIVRQLNDILWQLSQAMAADIIKMIEEG